MNRDEISTGISAQAPGIPVPMKPCPVDNTGNRIERHAHHGARKPLPGTGCREPARERRTAMPSPADRGDLSREFVTVSIAGTCVTLKFIL
ncbi:TPA: hypothetical protein ACK3RK_006152 [Burkholderia cepacia]